jgi:hypothetical protein
MRKAFSVDQLDARGRVNNALGYVLKENGRVTHALDVTDFDLRRLLSGGWASIVCTPIRDEDQSVFVEMIEADGRAIGRRVGLSRV